MSAVAPTPGMAPVALRHRRSVRRLSGGQVGELRQAIAAAQKVGDERGYQRWAGIHGLAPPTSSRHAGPLFLPWHRAYLYFFEQALQDRVPGVTLPWWDWTVEHGVGIPAPYARTRVDGRINRLASSPIQASGRRAPREKRTWRRPGEPSWLPTQPRLNAVMANSSFFVFQNQLEQIHDGVHGWVGGTMSDPAVAAYDPIFWAHHAMIDRLWHLWQLRHPGAHLPHSYLDTALPPFPITVRQTLDIGQLGYGYAAATAAVSGTRVVDRYHSKPLQLPGPAHRFHRADLAFYDVERSGPTYEGRIFVGPRRGPGHGAGVDHAAYAGSFYVFRHGGEADRDVQVVTVTDAVRRLVAAGRETATVSVFAHGPDGGALRSLEFSRLRLLTYA